MALHKLVRRNYGRKSPVSIKYKNLYSFQEVVILLCPSILETRITQLHGSALFIIPLTVFVFPKVMIKLKNRTLRIFDEQLASYVSL